MNDDDIWALASNNAIEEHKPLHLPGTETVVGQSIQERWTLPPLPPLTAEQQRLTGDARRQMNTERMYNAYYITRNAIRTQQGFKPLPQTAKIDAGTMMARKQPVPHSPVKVTVTHHPSQNTAPSHTTLNNSINQALTNP